MKHILLTFALGQEWRWKTLFMIFHSPSTLSNESKSVYLWPVQLLHSSRAIAIVSNISMPTTRITNSFAGPFWSFQSKSPWIGQRTIHPRHSRKLSHLHEMPVSYLLLDLILHHQCRAGWSSWSLRDPQFFICCDSDILAA
jgi:hypothetical protein